MVIPLRAGEKVATQQSSGDRKPPAAPVFHVVADGETLSEIAAKYYDDNDWTRIGKANGLSDPTKLRKGARLVSPPERS